MKQSIFFARLSFASISKLKSLVKYRICIILALLASAILLLPAPARLQRGGAFAIKGGKIVTVTGATLASGIVVIRNGVITDIGENIAIPNDAQIVDASGLSVYPGLIDAHTDLGMPQPQPSQIQPGGRRQGPLAQPPAQPQAQTQTSQPAGPQLSGLEPEVTAADLLKPGGDAIEIARSLGITTVLTVPREGIFAGQSALINLAGNTAEEMIIKTPVALHIGFNPPRSGSYPSTLMGVLAFLRQSFLDAQHYQALSARYAKDKRGMPRPPQDKSLMALQPVITADVPVIFSVNTENDIKRAINLAEEFKLRYILSGVSEGWKVTELLKAKKADVLVSLNFNPPRRRGGGFGGFEPESPEATERDRENLHKNAAAIQKAGIRFAFHSGNLQRPQEFLANALKAVESGLPRDEALKALTIYPAQILGVGEQLGSLEKGKIANIIVTTGDPLDRNTRVRHLFIDGRPVEVRRVEEQAQPGRRPGGPGRTP